MRTGLFLLCLVPSLCWGQRKPRIETIDITHFWEAYDQLQGLQTFQDSLQVIQTVYLDRATPHFRKFIQARHFSAREYVTLLRMYPGFWKSIRPLTERIASRHGEVERVLDELNRLLPGFKYPDVCFAIGCLRTGGTTAKDVLLIGAEIAAADATVDTTELSPWLKQIMGSTGDIVSMVAHETIHTQQRGIPFGEILQLLKYKRLSLLNMAIVEGSADFITETLLGLTINESVHAYGEEHSCAVWAEFQQSMLLTPFTYSPWLYTGNAVTDRPADLGYFVGAAISEAYYSKTPNKEKALRTLLRRGKYKKVYRESQYRPSGCDN